MPKFQFLDYRCTNFDNECIKIWFFVLMLKIIFILTPTYIGSVYIITLLFPCNTFVSNFRPIAYCKIVYKVIMKILAKRMEGALFSGRNMKNNIILGQYFKYISSRCTLKVDQRKTYDSIFWCFMKAMLRELNYVTSVFYSSTKSRSFHGHIC